MPKFPNILIFPIALIATSGMAQDAPTTRQMNLLAWQEFAEFVPSKIETVLIPVGTLEAHGVLPNGSDNLAPEAMAKELAAGLNALIAPTLNYGVTGALDAFPGTFSLGPDTYGRLISDILSGLAKNGFKNLIVLNGHGGPQTAILQRVAEDVGRQTDVRTMVLNWWTVVDDITVDVFGDRGGHAGNNESAYVQAVAPDHVYPDRYSKAMASARTEGVSAYPFPSSIVLYENGRGYPDFDSAKSAEYFRRVNEKMYRVIADIIARWDQAGLMR